MIDTYIPFRLFLADQQAFRVGYKSPVDESQADVIAEDHDLAYPRAHWSTAFFKVVTKAATVLLFGSIWSHPGNDIPELQHDIAQLWRHLQ